MCVLYSKRSIVFRGSSTQTSSTSRVQSLSETHEIPNTNIATDRRSSLLMRPPMPFEQHPPILLDLRQRTGIIVDDTRELQLMCSGSPPWLSRTSSSLKFWTRSSPTDV